MDVSWVSCVVPEQRRQSCKASSPAAVKASFRCAQYYSIRIVTGKALRAAVFPWDLQRHAKAFMVRESVYDANV